MLLVDDTWTSGTSMQSAAAALTRAGAASVTGLCVTRWLSRITATAFDPFSCIAYARVCVSARARLWQAILSAARAGKLNPDWREA